MTTPNTATGHVPDDALSDEELVGRCRGRDEAAVRAITRRYNRRLYRIARGILRNDGEAEDVVQETYVRAFTGLEGFRGESSFGTWLVRIAINDALGRVRARKAVVDWTGPDEDQWQSRILQFPSASTSRDPERIMAQSEIRVLLERSIDELPDVFRAVFVARIVDGMTIEETAELFGVRPQTVKTRVHRARRLLRTALDKRLGSVLADAFPFDGARCHRVTEAVVRRTFGAAEAREPFHPC